MLTAYCSARFAKAARVDDFSAKDISNPDRERTLTLLSAFINFVKFTEQNCNAFVKDLRDQSDAIVTERDQITEQLAMIQQEIEAVRCALIYTRSIRSDPLLTERK